MSSRIAVVLKGQTPGTPIIGPKTRDEYREAFTKAIQEKASTITVTDEDGDYYILVVDQIQAFAVESI
ncbi:hypothetical protein SEA_EVY_132 [Streptomyces phage Evy]|uniref:Uncharacterized protein n=2 Tax=Samistivirus TaxID=2560220 RepID=A0A0A0RM78_9CAUD|nr:hypothetical protein AXJ18_gp149 [Streptomyces phage Jay2Jay]YP_010103499.1 hypothetical protein KNU67_gp142 [Streptomyces phage Evy]AIW02625.1 hypothetical protein PBI_JAY2JAY_139 [Streptomyces phage Jay2Jay]QDH93990.1 hypothetical protein SEA_EVY_132 [Streptomyces phage Evy]UEM46911.1 hypothetical protein SEA_TARGARYEN_135 [Streptomyces phage Targaryen]